MGRRFISCGQTMISARRSPCVMLEEQILNSKFSSTYVASIASFLVLKRVLRVRVEDEA
jgi:hypothetical protein